MTSSMSAAVTPDRRTASCRIVVASTSGRVLTNEPLNDVPIAVRTALTMTGLGMVNLRDSGACGKISFETAIVSATVATTITGACWLLAHAETLGSRDRPHGGADALSSAGVLRRGCARATLRPGRREVLRVAACTFGRHR